MDHLERVHGSSLQAQAHIWNYIFQFINSMSLKCAVELRLPEAIHQHGGKPVTLSQLVSALGILPDKAAYLRRLMRLLTHYGFFATQTSSTGGDEGEEAYLLTTYSQHLISTDPHTISPFLRAMLDPMLLTPWQSLSAWFRVDSPTPFHHLNGTGIWDMISQVPEMNSNINEAMASDSHLIMDTVVKEHGEIFHQVLKSLVDIGGGNGATAMTLVKAFPQLQCTVLDLPHVVATAPKSSTVEFVAGDMFEYVPPADAVLLKWILHDWSDEHCVKLLKLCKEAIPPKEEGGKVIIIDMVVREDRQCHQLRETQYFFDLWMMVLTHGGKERSEKEWVELFNRAGFNEYKISTPGLGLRDIIVLYP